MHEPTPPADDAVQHAMTLLNRKALHSGALRHELIKAGFTPEQAQVALLRVIDLKLIDDEALARRRMERWQEQGPLGPARLQAQLTAEGFDQALIASLVAESRAQSEEQYAQALQYAQRQLATMKHLSVVQQQRRLAGRLQRRGFDTDIITRVMESLDHNESS